MAPIALAFSRHDHQMYRFKPEVTNMARTPNYDFERRERERLKNLKKAARAEAKQKRDTTEEAADETPKEQDSDD